MQHTVSVAAIRPDQQQRIFALRYLGQGLLHVGCGLNFVAIYFQDDVRTLQSGIPPVDW